MKGKGLVFLLLVLAATPGYPEGSSSPGSQVALSIVIDAGSSNRPVWNDLQALARQAVTSLQSGDYLEAISADPWDPHIRIASVQIQTRTGEVDNLCMQLRKIELPWIGDTDVIRALELGIDRMRKFRQDYPEATPVFIVLSDGQLRDEEATVCTTLTEQVENGLHGRLYFTGTKDTSRKLLIQAGNKTLHWSLLQSADCQNWIKEARRKPELKPVVKIEPVEPKAPEPAPDPKPKMPSAPTPVIVVPKSPIFQLPTDSYLFQGLSVQHQEPIRIEEPLHFPLRQPIEPNIPALATRAPVIADPNNEPTSVVSEPNAVTSQATPDTPAASPARPMSPWGWILGIAGIVVTAAGILFLVYARKYADQWRQRITKSLRSLKPQENAMLVARHKDRTWNLGKLNRRMEIPIGSGPKNIIRLFDKDVALQHLVVTVKGGVAWLKNLAPKPLAVNGVSIPSGKNSRIAFPTMVRLCDTVTLKFEIQKPLLANPQPTKEENIHGRDK